MRIVLTGCGLVVKRLASVRRKNRQYEPSICNRRVSGLPSQRGERQFAAILTCPTVAVRLTTMYAKVFRQIFDSSIANDYQVRFVFEDFLKLADINGVVDMTPEAIARVTNVPLKMVRHGITALESPDNRSRSKEHEGRRIIRLDDHRDWGWMIVNYDYYRKLASEEQRREKTRVRVARFKSKCKSQDGQTELGNAVVTLGNAGNAMEREREREKHREEESIVLKASEIYELYPRKVGKPKAIQSIIKALKNYKFETVKAATEGFSKNWNGAVDIQFCPHPSTWFNQERFNDDPATWVRQFQASPPPTSTQSLLSQCM